MTTPFSPARPAGLDRDQIQANILRPVPCTSAAHYFLAIEDPFQFRRFLSELEPRISMDSDPLEQGAILLGFTAEGLRVLEPGVVALFSEAFQEGMANRAQQIGDVAHSRPETWEGVFGTGLIHAVISVLAPAREQSCDAIWSARVLDREAREAKRPAPAGSQLLWICRSAPQDDPSAPPIEPFGFRDGISQPQILDPASVAAGAAAPSDAIAPGEFVLGYPDELDAVHAREFAARGLVWRPAAVHPLLVNGSYLVFRKLQQNLAEFRKLGDPEKRMGRSKSGDSLRGAAPTQLKRGAQPPNQFTFAEGELEGQYTPRDSHIRRVNPRDDPHQPGGTARLHRMLRRGASYREGGEQGLLFTCFNARIEDQFEFIQSVWLNSGNSAGRSSDEFDPIASSRSPCVSVRGGEYFFVPSRSCIQSLASAAPRADLPRASAQAAEDPYNLFDISPALVGRLLAEDAVGRPVPERGETVYFVGKHERILEILKNEKLMFRTEPYSARVGDAVRSGRFMVGLEKDSPVRARRRELLQRVLGPQGASAEQLSGLWLEELQRLETARPPAAAALDLVNEIARPVLISAFVNRFLGIPLPSSDAISPARLAGFFARRDAREVPPAWRKQLEELDRSSGDPQATGKANLSFWVRAGFQNTFANPFGIAEVCLRARQSGDELREHVDAAIRAVAGRKGPGLVPPTGSSPSFRSVLARAVESSPDSLDEVLLLLLELLGGGVETVLKAVANTVDILLTYPNALAKAREAVQLANQEAIKPGEARNPEVLQKAEQSLDAVIYECLRLLPVASLGLRRAQADARIGSQPIPAGSLVGLVIPVASKDPAVFGAGSRGFRSDPQPRNDLAFGAGPDGLGATHACVGEAFALAEIRVLLCWLLREDRQLRRAAGLGGRRKERAGMAESLYIRLDRLGAPR